jgi:hypothetical protein
MHVSEGKMFGKVCVCMCGMCVCVYLLMCVVLSASGTTLNAYIHTYTQSGMLQTGNRGSFTSVVAATDTECLILPKYIHTHIHTYIYTHTCITYMHTYMHTYMYAVKHASNRQSRVLHQCSGSHRHRMSHFA